MILTHGQCKEEQMSCVTHGHFYFVGIDISLTGGVDNGNDSNYVSPLRWYPLSRDVMVEALWGNCCVPGCRSVKVVG
jgi:hypothetical protein